MRGVSRIGIVVLIFAALLVAAEPTYHHHPLTGNAADGLSATAYCAICAVGGSQTVLTRPIVIPSAAVSYLLAVAPATLSRSAVRALLAARAPPAL
ncbi:MAG: hypothetical protein JWN02_2854 [Acidobacteria bacterium]|nr:hypothetical protein [Acidobacteriota bacterium]